MCGGDSEAYTKSEPIIDVYAKKCVRLGESGAGQLTKMVNQICIAGLVQGLSEVCISPRKRALMGAPWSMSLVVARQAAGR